MQQLTRTIWVSCLSHFLRGPEGHPTITASGLGIRTAPRFFYQHLAPGQILNHLSTLYLETHIIQ